MPPAAPETLSFAASLVFDATVLVVHAAALAAAFAALRRARDDLATLRRLRAAPKRAAGLAVVRGRACSDVAGPVVHARPPVLLRSGARTRLVPPLVMARQFWVETETGPVAVDPKPNTFVFDGAAGPLDQVTVDVDAGEFARPAPDLLSLCAPRDERTCIRSGDAIELLGTLAERPLPELGAGGFREAPHGFVLTGDAAAKLFISRDDAAFAVRRRARTLLAALGGSAALTALSLVSALADGPTSLHPFVVVVMIGASLLLLVPVGIARAADRDAPPLDTSPAPQRS
ncbi:MAG TPA: hypothetical protein VHB21_20340 [Minicystis sp.]|nr:hypothetical protein [Minicystis sp.]